MATVTWTRPALNNVREIAAHVVQDSPGTARKLAGRFFRATERLEDQPQAGWEVEEFGRADFREILVRPYRIIYRLVNEQCYIVAVIHGSRDLTQQVDPDAWSPADPSGE